MTEKRRIIALAGLSGAGKSTLIRAVLEESDFVHLSASDLIKEYVKDRDGQNKTSEKLRLGNISENQACFVEAFEEKARSIGRHIILDCHTVIDTSAGLVRVPVSTFEAIKITGLVFLSVSPAEISDRRIRDKLRPRPSRTVAELAEQQEFSLKAAGDISKALDIPLTILGENPEAELKSVLCLAEKSR